MCTVRTPKPVEVQPKAEKKVNILRNPFLDGVDPQRRAQQVGVGSFRIDRGSGTASIARPQPTRGASPVTPSVSVGNPPLAQAVSDNLGPMTGRAGLYRALQIARTPV